MYRKLYFRIWLAVVLAIAVLTLAVGTVWRMTMDPPMRHVVLRNAAGEVLGAAAMRPLAESAQSHWHSAETDPDGDKARHAQAEGEESLEHRALPVGQFGRGPEFLVQMEDGQVLHVHMPRPELRPWMGSMGYVSALCLVAFAVALGTYPVVRRLTRRLENLQKSVEAWGDGNLGVRAAVEGHDEAAFLAQRFNDAAQRLEALVQARDALLESQKSLLANASHELRSPLARLRMGLELLQGGGERDALRQELERNISELDQLIGEILLASRLDAQQADLGAVERVDLVPLCAEECAHTGARLDSVDAVVQVHGVPKLLRRAVRNLLENASRHGSATQDGAGARGVILELRAFPLESSAVVRLAVMDHGPGVPVEYQQRVFEPFYRLPGVSETGGGVGLGLALVKAIAERHGGSVRCVNNPQGGARFELTLPVGRAMAS
ncbi:MAG: sensor histidine kinase [Betaproteobacteria bacterium]|nr:sensor histidine kinase [Betaproteobacteria bacterium]